MKFTRYHFVKLGKVKSKKKAKAVRINGRKGGRPKKPIMDTCSI